MCCELPVVFKDSETRARKVHRCCECDGRIEVGETYHLVKGLWDGMWSTYKVCVDCDALRQDVDKGVKWMDERTPFEGLSDAVMDADHNMEFSRRFLAICEKRGAKVPGWLEERCGDGKA